jgi:hypothetical protein
VEVALLVVDGDDAEQVPEDAAVLLVVEQLHRDPLAPPQGLADGEERFRVRARALQKAAVPIATPRNK